SAENRQKPHHATEDPRQRAGLFCGEIQLFLKIYREGRERAVVRNALEDFADVGNPERPLEPIANFLQPLAKTHRVSERLPGGIIAETRVTPYLTGIPDEPRVVAPAAIVPCFVDQPLVIILRPPSEQEFRFRVVQPRGLERSFQFDGREAFRLVQVIAYLA